MRAPRYATYKDSGVGWLGDVPRHWSIVASRRLFAQRKERVLPNDRQLTASQTYGVIFQDDFMEREGRAVVRVVHGTDILKHVEPNDFVISMRSFQGGIEWCEERGCISSAYVVLVPNRRVVPEFFRYLLKSDVYIQALQSTTNLVRDGQAMRYENFTQIALPDIPQTEQSQIATFLDRETAKIDELVQEQQRFIELLNEKRQAIISQAVTKGLNPDALMTHSGIEWIGTVPKQWQVLKLKHICAEKDGIQMGPFGGMLLDLSPEDTGFRVYGQQNTIAGDFTLGDRWIKAHRFSSLERYWLTVGDIVLTRKGSLGNARSIDKPIEPGIIDSDTIRLRIRKDVASPTFISFLLHECKYLENEIDTMKRGAILAGLNSETVANLVIALPRPREQDLLMQFIYSFDSKFNAVISETKRANELLYERRAALISAAVTGKIDVRQMAEVQTA
jgi:type I restriction enzyme S subunit